jgi:hypothetical protein
MEIPEISGMKTRHLQELPGPTPMMHNVRITADIPGILPIAPPCNPPIALRGIHAAIGDLGLDDIAMDPFFAVIRVYKNVPLEKLRLWSQFARELRRVSHAKVHFAGNSFGAIQTRAKPSKGGDAKSPV